MPHDRLSRAVKKLQPKRQKEPGNTITETSGSLRPEWFNKSPTP